jgi:predicted RND superfamily exporter protein
VRPVDAFHVIFQAVTNMILIVGIVYVIGFIRRVERERHHRFRSPVAAIKGLAEAAPVDEDTNEALMKQIRAIGALADDALAAVEERERPPRPRTR